MSAHMNAHTSLGAHTSTPTIADTTLYVHFFAPGPYLYLIINRPGVSGGDLQTALSVIDLLIDSLSR